MYRIKQIIVLIGILNISSVTMAQFKNPHNLDFTWKTDTTITNVDLSEITVVLPKGTFPKLDYPEFLKKDKGLKSFILTEPVIMIEINGEAKAYPLNMLTTHEISNDIIGDIPILATYCPLCNAGVVYDRRIKINGKEEVLQFEVSGMLRRSDMVMLDTKTESLWQQLMGTAMIGKFTGTELQVIPSLIISVNEFFNSYPDGIIVSPYNENGELEEQYRKNPYVGYDKSDGKPMGRFFDHDVIDGRLPAMERVIDIQVNGKYKIYPFSAIQHEDVINDSFNGADIVIFHQQGTTSILDKSNIAESKAIGSATLFSPLLEGRKLTFSKKDSDFVDNETGSIWDITGKAVRGELKGKQLMIEPHSNHFAFAWLSFYPESDIYGEGQ